MRLDQYKNPVFNEDDLFEALYKGQSLSAELYVDSTPNTRLLEEQASFKFWTPLDDYDLPLAEYDSALQTDWFMPDEYKILDIEKWILSQTPPWDPNYARVLEELTAYKERKMLDLLRWLKYFVDTMRANKQVWGVGRGSSVASYVLYLIGVHKVDSLKYNLDWREFLR